MAESEYQKRKDVIHDLTVYIEDLLKDNAALNVQLRSADKQVATLKVELMRMENGQLELTAKFNNAQDEVGRLEMILHHQQQDNVSIQNLPPSAWSKPPKT